MSSSTDPEEDDLVLVGRLGRPHGLRGFLVLFPESDNDARFAPGSQLQLVSGESLTVRGVMAIPHGLALAFDGFEDRTAAEKLRGAELFVESRARRRLELDEYWPDQLVGLVVRDIFGAAMGVVAAVDDASAQTRLTVDTDTGQYLVPLVRALIPEISIESGYLVVADIPGLLGGDD